MLEKYFEQRLNNENNNKIRFKFTPFPDRHQLIEWKITQIEDAITKGDIELVNSHYAGLIELVRQQNINTHGALDDYLQIIKEEYDNFRKEFICKYPKNFLPSNLQNSTTMLNETAKMDLHQSNMQEATRLKESGNIEAAIQLILNSYKQTGFLDSDKLSAYLAQKGDIENAVQVLKNAMSKTFPYNNHSLYWRKISSIYFKTKDMNNYLYALTISIMYQLIHTDTIIGDIESIQEFYRSQSVEYFGLTNISRYIKITKQPNFIDKYNTILMQFFNEIKPQILEYCFFRSDNNFSQKEMDFFSKYSFNFFDEFYNSKIKNIILNSDNKELIN